MKLAAPTSKSRRIRSRGREGLAVILMLTLLAILLIYVAGNVRALYNLERELKFTERRQTRRLESASLTNTPAISGAVTNAAPAAEPTAPPAR